MSFEGHQAAPADSSAAAAIDGHCPEPAAAIVPPGAAAVQSHLPEPFAVMSPMHVGPLSLDDLANYVPKQDGSNRRLGLTIEGALRFLEKINFLQWTRSGDKDFRGRDALSGWSYSRSYCRSDELAWVADLVGVPEEGSQLDGGRKHICGHDLLNVVQGWLRAKGQARSSVCEVILCDPDFAEIRPHVGIANVYVSPASDAFGFAGYRSFVKGKYASKSLLASVLGADEFSDELPPLEQRFHFFHYFSLRVCLDEQAGFHPNPTVEVIRDIGCAIFCMDDKWECFKHSHNVLEMFAAVNGNCKIACSLSSRFGENDLRMMFQPLAPGERPPEIRGGSWNGPIDLREARTYKDEDKRMVDMYVEAMPGGFARMDATMMEAILQAARKGDQR